MEIKQTTQIEWPGRQQNKSHGIWIQGLFTVNDMPYRHSLNIIYHQFENQERHHVNIEININSTLYNPVTYQTGMELKGGMVGESPPKLWEFAISQGKNGSMYSQGKNIVKFMSAGQLTGPPGQLVNYCY